MFAGSGTTLIAAAKTGRCGYGIELDPHYCDVIVRRLAEATKVEAIHADSGDTFSAIERRRAVEGSAQELVNNNPESEVGHVEG